MQDTSLAPIPANSFLPLVASLLLSQMSQMSQSAREKSERPRRFTPGILARRVLFVCIIGVAILMTPFHGVNPSALK